MVLVFIFLFLVATMITIILSWVSIRVEKFKLSNCTPNAKLNFDYNVYFELYFLNIIRIFSLKIDKKLVNKFNFKDKIKGMDFNKMKTDMPSKKEQKEIIKKLDVQLEKFNLIVELGTFDVLLTTGIIATLSSLIGIILAKAIKKYSKEKYYYEIRPLYENKNLITLSLNCIIKVKVVHIIFIIYDLVKRRRVDNNERTSNRRAYGYSYE